MGEISKEERDLEYYSRKSKEDLFKEMDSSINGLSSSAAWDRIKLYGHNLLEERRRTSTLIEFLKNFKSPLIIILLVAAGFSAYFGEIINAAIIGAMILISVTLNFFQEHSAQKAAEKLKETVKTKVVALRDGKNQDIHMDDLVIGDIISLSAGDIVPADARLITSKDFFVNQSSLTGESLPAEKYADFVPDKVTSFSELHNMVFMGTNVVSGSATAIVVRTGKATEFGRISRKLASRQKDTEFEKGIMSFGNLIMKATIFLVLFIFLFNAIAKRDVFESFMFAIAVAVGLTPELLPMIMSVNMAKCSISMAKKGVIVKRLSSIPNLGSMDVLCTDKTGTLTEDKIRLVKYVNCSGKDSERVLTYSYLNSFYQTGIRNPLDQAVMEFRKISIGGYEKVDEIPFDFVRKRMSVIVEEKKGKRFIISKGAPEEIIKICSDYDYDRKSKKLDSKSREKIIRQYHTLSSEGYRVLAVAVSNVPKKKAYEKVDEQNLEFLGFIAFLDPPKSDVREVLEEIHDMGIEVKILTGDNEFVTQKVCDEIGLSIKGILLGTQLVSLTDDALRVAVENTTIFARVSPEQKTRIIYALQANNHVVGYIGDGINDASSLKDSDVGISVNSAVDVAKESASIVLTHKSLRVLKDGIIDGRKTFGNTMKYIMMNLSSNFGNMFSVAGAILFLPFLPMLPLQILLNNFLYDFSQLTIPADNVDKNFIDKPKRWNMKFVRNFMLFFGPISSVFDFLTFFIMLYLFHAPAGYFQTAWFMESLATQTLVIYVIRTKNTPFLESKPHIYLTLSTLAAVIIGWILPYTPIGDFFGFEHLPLNIVLVLAGLVLSYLMLVEIGKRYFYSQNDF